MNKLGLGRQTIYTNLDAEATVKLKKYLNQLKLYSALSKDSSEVYTDIYALVYEKIQDEFLKSAKKLNITAITKILDKIGTPKEILSNNDIDVEKLIAANPLIKINLAVSNFVLGENKRLSMFLKVIGFTITVSITLLTIVVFLAISDVELSLKDPLFYDFGEFGPLGNFVRNLTISYVPLVILGLFSLFITFFKKVSSNLFYTAYIIIFIIFTSTLLSSEGSYVKRAAILINNYRSVSTSDHLDRTQAVTIGEAGYKEISIQIRVNQINDIPDIHILKAGDRNGASFSYPYGLAEYGEGFLYSDPERKSLQLSFDAVALRKMCGIKCLIANGSKPELYVYADDKAKVSIKYFYSNEMSIFGYGSLPVEIKSIDELSVDASSSNGSHVVINGQDIDSFELTASESASLAVTGYFKTINITSNDRAWISMGFNEIVLDADFKLNYSGYDQSIVNFAYLGDSTIDLYDRAVLMYMEKGDGEYTINKHSDEATVID